MRVLIRSIYTFLLYFIVLMPTVILVKQATIKLNKKRKFGFLLCSFFALLLPCLFSGFRGENVGVDVLVYAKPVYNLASRSNSLSYLLGLETRYEVGFRTIAYIASHLFGSFNAQLFITQLLIVLPVYTGAMILRDRYEPWLVMLSFYCMFYIETFNIMRQGIAVAFSFLAFVLMLKKRFKTSVITAMIGYLFHSSVLIGYALLVLVSLFERIKSHSLKVFLLILLTIGIPVLMRFWAPILAFLGSKGIVPIRYVRYFILNERSYLTTLGMTNYFELLFRWLGVLIPLVVSKNVLREKNSINYSIFIGVLLATMVYTSFFVFLHSSYGYRITFYLEILFILWIPSIYKKPRTSVYKSLKIPTVNAAVFMALFLCFYIGYMILGFHRTLPFYFQIY